MKGYPDNMLENRQLYKKYLQSAKKKFYIVYKNNCKNTESKNCNRALDIFHFSVLHVQWCNTNKLDYLIRLGRSWLD